MKSLQTDQVGHVWSLSWRFDAGAVTGNEVELGIERATSSCLSQRALAPLAGRKWWNTFSLRKRY
jgi:hypothetical protein